METQDPLVLQVLLELQVQQVRLVVLAQMVHPELRVLQVEQEHQDHLDRQGTMVLMEPLEHQGHLVPLVLPDHRVSMVPLEIKEPLVSPVKQEPQECRVQQDQVVLTEQWVLLETRDCKDGQDHRGLEDQRASQVVPALREPLEESVRRVERV